MPKIIIDGKTVECRDGVPVLQAALEAGWDIPHYCYHPGLSVVASCRLCLMEMKMPDPRTKEPGWAPKLFPSCQTPVKDGMEVRFDSEFVQQNQKHTMEYYLLNHPLDCPVCDKAGECYLQDYSEKFGASTSRMIEEKHKNPKKDIGSRTLLYQDRCVLCTRCVRFCDEVAGAGELRVVDRGSRAEIDVFPGVPLENELQGNVVDLCPVGALLGKEFLFRQRVWNLRSTPSVSPADSGGASIWIDHNEHGVHRVRPRWNEKTNRYWISDEQRFDWNYIQDPKRLSTPVVRRGGESAPLRWEEVPQLVRYRFQQFAGDGGAGCAAVLSPMMTCEEAWLLAKFVREIAPSATLALGYVPTRGADRSYPGGYVLRAEKCPNRRGVEAILRHFGGATCGWDEFVKSAGESKYKVAYVVGGYSDEWISKDAAAALAKVEALFVHDLLPSPLTDRAVAVLPGATWAERDGTFVNCDGVVQRFERAVPPLDGVRADGQALFELAGGGGLFRSRKVHEELGAAVPALADVFEPRPAPEFAH